MIPFGMLAFLLAFASAHSGIPIPFNAAAPVVTFSARVNDTPHACGEEWAAETNLRTGAITLAAGWMADKPDDVCTLAHELVHFLQAKHGPPFIDVETPAYKVTAACYATLYHQAEGAQWASAQQVKHAGGRCQ